MPGAEALIRRCHQLAVPMALATSSARAAVALKAAPHDWLGLIEIRVHGDDPELGAGKPAPDVFLLAARRLAVDPRQCWAFEDSPAGAQAAAAAGCRVYVLRCDATTTAPFPPDAHLLDSLEQVIL
jgi:HAD superfamily hydrolase (TIGR01509 family)